MQKTKRLSQRITLSFLLLGAVLTLLLGLSLVIALKAIEINILDDILYTEPVSYTHLTLPTNREV